MSAKLMGQVYDILLPRSAKSVLLALADHADHEGQNAYPGVALLSYKTELSERQVQRCLAYLTDIGLIVAEGNVLGGRGKKPVYSLHLEKGDKKAPFSKWAKEQTGKGDIGDIKGDIVSPINGLKGDIGDTERVTSCPLKGDIGDIAYIDAGASDFEPSYEPSHEKNKNPLPPAGGDAVLVNEINNPLPLPELGERPKAPIKPKFKPGVFERVLQAYPAGFRESKPLIIQRWDRLRPTDEEVNAMLIFIEAAKKTDRWRGNFIKQFKVFLSERTWEDDLSGYANRSVRNGNSDSTGPADTHLSPSWQRQLAAERAKAERAAPS